MLNWGPLLAGFAVACDYYGALVELYGAWMWGRAPGKLFVHDPWWPFAALTGT